MSPSGELCFPNISEPLAEVASYLPELDALTEEGNLQRTTKFSLTKAAMLVS